jgi:hypothetical protein
MADFESISINSIKDFIENKRVTPITFDTGVSVPESTKANILAAVANVTPAGTEFLFRVNEMPSEMQTQLAVWAQSREDRITQFISDGGTVNANLVADNFTYYAELCNTAPLALYWSVPTAFSEDMYDNCMTVDTDLKKTQTVCIQLGMALATAQYVAAEEGFDVAFNCNLPQSSQVGLAGCPIGSLGTVDPGENVAYVPEIVTFIGKADKVKNLELWTGRSGGSFADRSEFRGYVNQYRWDNAGANNIVNTHQLDDLEGSWWRINPTFPDTKWTYKGITWNLRHETDGSGNYWWDGTHPTEYDSTTGIPRDAANATLCIDSSCVYHPDYSPHETEFNDNIQDYLPTVNAASLWFEIKHLYKTEAAVKEAIVDWYGYKEVRTAEYDGIVANNATVAEQITAIWG